MYFIKINFFNYINHPAPAVVISPSLNLTKKSWCKKMYIVLDLSKSPPELISNINSIGLTSFVFNPDKTLLSLGSDIKSNP